MNRYIIIFCFITNLKVGMQLKAFGEFIDKTLEEVIPMAVVVALSNEYRKEMGI